MDASFEEVDSATAALIPAEIRLWESAACKQDGTIHDRIQVPDCNKPYQLGAPGKNNARQQRSRLYCVSSRANLAPSHAFGGGYDGFKNDDINRVRRMLVALGAGAVLSSLIGAFPQIVWLSERKLPLFLVAGVMLAGALLWQARRNAALACPPDAALAAACATSKDYSLIVYRVSVAIYVTGFFFAFVAPLVI